MVALKSWLFFGSPKKIMALLEYLYPLRLAKILRG